MGLCILQSTCTSLKSCDPEVGLMIQERQGPLALSFTDRETRASECGVACPGCAAVNCHGLLPWDPRFFQDAHGLPRLEWGQDTFPGICHLGHILGVRKPFNLCYNNSTLLLRHRHNHMLLTRGWGGDLPIKEHEGLSGGQKQSAGCNSDYSLYAFLSPSNQTTLYLKEAL